MTAEISDLKHNFVVEAVSEIHTAYRNAQKLKVTREAFINLIKRKRQKGESSKEIENTLNQFLSTSFPDRQDCCLQLNWEEGEYAEKYVEKYVLNSKNPLFLTKKSSPSDSGISDEEIAGRNVLQAGWGMWTHHSYEQWRKWYINKPDSLLIGNPIILTLTPVMLPLAYYVPRAAIAIRELVMGKYNDDDSSVVKLESFLENKNKEATQPEMLNADAELHFMQTFMIHDYHEKSKNKFVKKLNKGMEGCVKKPDMKSEAPESQSLFQNRPGMLSSSQKIVALTHTDTDALLQEKPQDHLKKYKISPRGMVVAGVTAFFAGFFAWPVSLFANTHIVGAVGLTTATVLTGAIVVIGLAGGALYVYNSYRESKKINKKIDSLEESSLLEQQEKILHKNELFNSKLAHTQDQLKDIQLSLKDINKKSNVENYKQTIEKKNKFIQDMRYRKEVRQLKSNLIDLEDHCKQLSEQIKKKTLVVAEMREKYKTLTLAFQSGAELKEKELAELKESNSAIVKRQIEIDVLLPEQIKATEKLITQKQEKQIELAAKLNNEDVAENSFYDSFRDFIGENEGLSFLSVFLKKGDEFLKINRELKELEKEADVKSSLAIQKEKTKIENEETQLLAKIEKQSHKMQMLQTRHNDYRNIGEKMAEKEKLSSELKEINQNYRHMVENYLKEVSPERREEIKQKLLYKGMREVNLKSLDYLLQYKQADEPKTATVPALVNLKHSIWGPGREDTPHSVKQAFKELGMAVINDVWAVGQKISEYYSAASAPTCVANIVGLGIMIGGVVVSPGLLIAGAALGVVFTGNYIYEEYKKSENTVRDAFLDDSEFALSAVDEYIDALKKRRDHFIVRNEKVETFLKAEINSKNGEWLDQRHSNILKSSLPVSSLLQKSNELQYVPGLKSPIPERPVHTSPSFQ